jgi:hypothetical protein
MIHHYRNRVLCRVSKTLGKDYFTLGKGFAECNTRQRTLGKYFIGKGFFAECFFQTLGKDFANSPTIPYYITRCPIIFHYYFESNLYVL